MINSFYDSSLSYVFCNFHVTYRKVFVQATFEAFIGIRDDKATAQLKLFGDHLQVLSVTLPQPFPYIIFICKVHFYTNKGLSVVGFGEKSSTR